METEELFETYLEALLKADRSAARDVIRRALGMGHKAQVAYEQLLWPAMERIDQLLREEQISLVTEHFATRINRFLADQIQTQLLRREKRDKKALVLCAPNEPEELGAQMISDLLEADGWDCCFLGGGVPQDEILELVGSIRPDLLVIYGTKPAGTPGVRQMIDKIRDVGACPMMNVMVGGGIFNRVEGLWEEINADFWAATARDAVKIAGQAEQKEHLPRIPGAPKKRRRRLSPVGSDN